MHVYSQVNTGNQLKLIKKPLAMRGFFMKQILFKSTQTNQKMNVNKFIVIHNLLI